MEPKNKLSNLLASIGLAVGSGFGLAGSMVQEATLQNTLWEISSVGLIFACVLLFVKYYRASKDFIAAGFLLLGIAEAVMSSGTAAGLVGAQPSFGAGMHLYLPALLLISVPKFYAIWIRLAGIAACVPFMITASSIFSGNQVLATSPLPGTGYGILTIAMIGWIITLLREKP
jgi:hypothetical protein